MKQSSAGRRRHDWQPLSVLLAGALAVAAGRADATVSYVAAVEFDPPAAEVGYGQSTRMSYVLVNAGDEALGSAFATTSYVESGPAHRISISPGTGNSNSNCPRFVQSTTNPETGIRTLYVSSNLLPWPIPPGATRRCSLLLTIAASAPSAFRHEFFFAGGTAATTEYRRLQIDFAPGELPRPIPGPAPLTLAITALMMLLSAMRWGRAARNPRSVP